MWQGIIQGRRTIGPLPQSEWFNQCPPPQELEKGETGRQQGRNGKKVTYFLKE